MWQGRCTRVKAIMDRNQRGMVPSTSSPHHSPHNNCRQSSLHAFWTQSQDFLHASQRMQSTSWMERYCVGLKCSVQCRRETGGCRLKSTLRVNPPAIFVNHAHQNRSLPKLTCYLSHSAPVLFTLPDTENQRQLLQTSLCIVVFI